MGILNCNNNYQIYSCQQLRKETQYKVLKERNIINKNGKPSKLTMFGFYSKRNGKIDFFRIYIFESL